MLSIIPMLFTLMWGSQPNIDTSTVNDFDLENYLGVWYEIARFDNRFERDLEYVTAEYTLLKGGGIEVMNRGRNSISGRWQQSRGRAKVSDQPGALRVSFFLWFYSDYNVMELAEDYSWALVGSSSPDFLWILAREKNLKNETLEHILHLAQNRGYDTTQLIYPKQ